MTSTHQHTCQNCGRDFDHDNRSVILCNLKERLWRCSACVLESLYGPTSQERK